MARPGVMFYFDVRSCIRRLSLADKGQLFESILDYAENGVEPELDGALGVAWDFIKPRIDLDSEQYELKVETSQYAAFSRERKKLGLEPIDRDEWRSMTDTERRQAISSDESDTPATSGGIGRCPNSNSNSDSNSNSTSAPNKRYMPTAMRAARFTPPTLEEVQAYVSERQSPVDPQAFIDFYAAKGWMVGKTPMRDWRAACRNAEQWERWKVSPPAAANSGQHVQRHDAPLSDLERQAVARMLGKQLPT